MAPVPSAHPVNGRYTIANAKIFAALINNSV